MSSKQENLEKRLIQSIKASQAAKKAAIHLPSRSRYAPGRSLKPSNVKKLERNSYVKRNLAYPANELNRISKLRPRQYNHFAITADNIQHMKTLPRRKQKQITTEHNKKTVMRKRNKEIQAQLNSNISRLLKVAKSLPNNMQRELVKSLKKNYV